MAFINFIMASMDDLDEFEEFEYQNGIVVGNTFAMYEALYPTEFRFNMENIISTSNHNGETTIVYLNQKANIQKIIFKVSE